MRLQLQDWGGQGEVLHFAHANGFPPGTYRALIERLKSRFRVVTLHTRCLSPDARPEDVKDWEPFADDLVEALRAAGHRQVVGVGHSLGGVATLLAAQRAPELFRSVVALDPVIFSGWRAVVLRGLRATGLISRVPPASLSRQRRETWASRNEAGTSYGKKALFHDFDAACFDDYLHFGLVDVPGGGVRLAISREWEARVFETGPASVRDVLPALTQPVTIVRGASSTTFTASAAAAVREWAPQVKSAQVRGGHLFPLEDPVETAAQVLAACG